MPYADFVQEITTTTGVGPVTLGGAQAGFRAFGLALTDGQTLDYEIDDGASGREVGSGTYHFSTNTLSRDTVFSSTNAGAPVSFGAGNKTVRLTCSANFLNRVLVSPFGTQVLTDPTSSSDHGNQYLDSITLTQTGINNTPNFSNQVGKYFDHEVWSGWNTLFSTGNDQAKLTFVTHNNVMNAYGSGQREVYATLMNGYGQGDLLLDVKQISFACGVNATGDEGQGLMSLQCQQQQFLVKRTITSVVQATVNTTTTQIIALSLSPQTVTVGSTTGLSPNQYVYLDSRGYSDADWSNCEAVFVTALTSTSITGIFRRNHVSGVTVTGALVVTVNDHNYIGQGRMLVNRTVTPYTTGTATGTVNSHTFTGSGTTWTSGLSGATSVNQGAIALTADNISAAPFSAGNPLVDWYMISAVTDDTHLDIRHWSTIGGSLPYTGLGLSPGAYQIAPAAIIMTRSFDPSNINGLVLSPNSFTWTVGDTVECSISNDCDVTGINMRFYGYTPGGTFRTGIDMVNAGLVPYQTGINLHGSTEPTRPYSWLTGIQIQDTQTCLSLSPKSDSLSTAIGIAPGLGSHVHWGNLGSPGFYWNNSTSYLEWIAGKSGNVIGTRQTGKLMISPLGAATTLWQIGGALTLFSGSGSDESPFTVESENSDGLQILPVSGSHVHKFIYQYNGGGYNQEVMRMGTFGVGQPGISFFGAALDNQQTVTGSRGGNAALASLLTKLGAGQYNLIIDNTTS